MKFIKRISAVLMAAVIWIVLLGGGSVSGAYSLPLDIKLQSQHAYMVNLDTGTVIYENHADGAENKTYPASLTKIMTAIIAIEAVGDLEGTVVTAPAHVYDEFVGLNVSTADIRQGENVRMIDLLYALLLQSACESASIIADYVGEGSIEVFVEKMNQKAAEIGAVNTKFTNAHGLFDPAQVTTAKDMYLIAKYALELPMFEKICTTTSYLMPVTNKHAEERYVVHTNNMLSKSRGGEAYYYEDMRGIKTGTLDEVGKNLVSMASRDGYNYLLVTLEAPDDEQNGSYLDAIALYDWAFSGFAQQKILQENEVVDEVEVRLSSKQDYVRLVAKEDVLALLPKDVDTTAIQRIRTIPDSVNAPVKKGDVMGTLELKLQNEVIATVDLIASEDLPLGNFLYMMDVTGRFFKQPYVWVLLVVLVLLLFLFLAVWSRYRRMKRRRDMRNRRRR